MLKHRSTFRYSAEFSDTLFRFYANNAASDGTPNPRKIAQRTVARELFTLECRRKMPMDILGRYVDLTQGTILDVGCGTGRNSVLASERGAIVIAIDVDEAALPIAELRAQEHNANITFEAASATSLPFEAERFDAVIFHNVLEHIPRELHFQAISEMFRVLRHEGVLFIQTPNRLNPFDIHTTRLPLLHWLPRSLSRHVTLLGIPAPHEDRMTYNEIVEASTNAAPAVVLNKCDVWEDLTDFRKNHVNYSNSFGVYARLYFTLIPPMYFASKVVQTQLNKWLPALNLFIRKVSPD